MHLEIKRILSGLGINLPPKGLSLVNDRGGLTCFELCLPHDRYYYCHCAEFKDTGLKVEIPTSFRLVDVLPRTVVEVRTVDPVTAEWIQLQTQDEFEKEELETLLSRLKVVNRGESYSVGDRSFLVHDLLAEDRSSLAFSQTVNCDLNVDFL